MNDICPLCQEEKTYFEAHHIIWRTEGGTSDPSNLIRICKTCHQTINYGDPTDSVRLEQKCFIYQLGHYGLNFILKSGLLTSNHRLKDKVLGAVESNPDISAQGIDLIFKSIGTTLTE